MALQIPSGFSQCAIMLDSTWTVDPWYVTFGVEASPNAAAAETIRSYFTTHIMPKMASTISAKKMRMWDESNVEEVTFAVTGGFGSDSLPANCATLIKKNTGRVGRRHQGRIFLPGMVGITNTSSGNTIQSTKLTELQTAVTSWFAAMDTGANNMVILHNEPGSPTPTPVTSLSVDGTLATQRRRMR